MKLVISCFFFFLASIGAMAQARNNPNSRFADTGRITDIREKLVQLAMQNPNYEVADRMVNKSFYELRKTKASWLGALSVTGNINEFTINPPAGLNNQVNLYPKYNFGLNVPFDLFTNKTNDIKIARENYLIAEANRNEKYRQVRTEVLSQYEVYLMYKAQLDLQTRITQDEYTIYITKEKDYQENIIQQEEYTRFYRLYADQLSRKLENQKNYNVAKLELEALIGVPIEQVLASIK